MSRPLRIQYPGAVYHVMNRGADRQKIFLTKKDCRAFLAILEDAFGKWKFELYAYCLMGNHYHLCLKTPEAKLARIMRHINGVYTQHFNRIHKRDGALFRGRYKAMVIEEEEYLSQVVRYIHLNPVDARMVERPQDYPWSSHKLYLARRAPDWLLRGPILAWFGSVKYFHEYVLEGNDRTLTKMYQHKRWPVILGSENFIERLRMAVEQPSNEHVREERQFIRPSMERILKAFSDEFNVPITQITEGRRGKANNIRKASLWALKEWGDFTHGQLASVFGMVSGKTIGWACQEIKKEIKENSRMRRRIQVIRATISQPET